MEQYIILASIAIAFFACALFVYKLVRHLFTTSAESKLNKKLHQDEIIQKKLDNSLNSWLRKRRTGTFSFFQIDAMLDSTGARYRKRVSGDDYQTPADYLIECIEFIGIGAVLGAGLPIVLGMFVDGFAYKPFYSFAGIPIGLLCAKVPHVLMSSADRKDNKHMLTDINDMYETLKVCTAAGIPLLDGLSECYRQVETPRLKYALLELTGSIRSGKNMEESIETLRKQFTSPEVTQFCIVIRQGLETGRQEETLTDLTANMRALQDEINHQIEETLNTKGQLIQMGLLFALMFIILYATVTTLNGQFAGMM